MAQAVNLLGVDKVRDLSDFYGGDPKLEPDPAIDLSLIYRGIIELYTAFREPIRFTPDEIVAEYRGDSAVARVDDALAPTAIDLSDRRENTGSNNWVISGKRTQSGRPLLMNDPRRVQQAPSLRYWSHLVAPGRNVIGGGEPTLPGVSIGHNEFGAWGLTIFGTDGEDLYVYETNPANANQYNYRGAWEDMRIIKDTVAVKGEAPVVVDLKFTRHGPVLFEDKEHHRAYALRAAWMETGSAPYLASLRMDQAKSWDEFREACSYSPIPAENMVWADVSGTIGYQAVAITPIRRRFRGLVRVPGDGRYEWDGYLPIKALPHALNPEKGYWATANNYLFPLDYQYPDAQHHTGTDPYRVSRISEVLGTGRLHTVADMIALQNDDLSLPARAAGAAAARPGDPGRHSRQGPRRAAGVERRARQGLSSGWHLRDVAAPDSGQHAQPRHAAERAQRLRQRRDDADHRVDAGAGRALRPRSDRRTRQSAHYQPGASRRRVDQALRC